MREFLGSVAAFAALWWVTAVLIAYIGGWARLASGYRTRQPFTGQRWRFRSGQFGFANYGGVLVFGANEEGLRLSILPCSAPDWNDVAIRPGRALFFEALDFHFRHAPHVRVRVAKGLGEQIRSAAGPRWLHLTAS